MSRMFAILCLLTVPLALRGSGRADEPASPEGLKQLPAEVARLIEQLDSEQFEVRRRAAGELEELLEKPELKQPLAAEFRRVLLRVDVSFEVRWQLDHWMERLPEVQLEAPRQVAPEELDRLIDRLDDDAYAARVGAARRLEWLMSQDEHFESVKQRLNSRLAEQPDEELAVRLRRLLELARPALVAEYWQGRRNLSQQHLLLGVPSLGEGAVRPSHFDRIDDETAHCVSGNSLSPGDYPVGVAFPHPQTVGAVFHLVNLPTPKRRLAYARDVRRREAVRLAELSRRTLDRLLGQKRVLDEPELLMLPTLDPKEVSRFAGKYLLAVEDEPLPNTSPLRYSAGGRPSRHGMLCVQLAVDGTKEAIPGLLRAIDEHRFLPPTSRAQHRLQWMAALAIALRDPWPKVDDWLAEQVGNTELFVHPNAAGPEVGATAAAMLLKRHGQRPGQFGLRPAGESLLGRHGVEGYRFGAEKDRAAVGQWWQQQSEQGKRKA